MGIFNSAIFNNRVFNTGTVTPVSGGGGDYRDSHYDRIKDYRERQRLEEQLAKNKAEKLAEEKRLAKLEAKRQKDLEDEQMQTEVLVMLKHLAFLDSEYERLMQLLLFYQQDEDDVLILLMSM